MPKRDLAGAKRIAFQLLKFRSRSSREIIDRLKRKGFSEEVVSQVIVFLERLKYLNDEEFALSFAQSRLLKPVGLKRIYFELEQKGVAKEIIEQTLEKLKESYSEPGVVARIARGKFKRIKGLDKFKAKGRVFAFLLRKGFDPETIKDALENL